MDEFHTTRRAAHLLKVAFLLLGENDMEDTLGSQKQRGVCMSELQGKEGYLKDSLSCRISGDEFGSGCYELSHCERASLIAGDT